MENKNKPSKIAWFLSTCWRYDVTTRTGRRVQTLKIIGVAMIAVLGLLVFVVEDVHVAREEIKNASTMQDSLESSIKVAKLIHNLQVERGLTVLCFGARGKAEQKHVLTDLSKARKDTNASLGSIEHAWPFDESLGEFMHNAASFRKHLNTNRDEVGKRCETGTSENQIQFYTNPIDIMLDWFFSRIQEASKNIVSVEFIGYYMLLTGQNKIGIERALGGSFFSHGQFNSTNHLIFYANQSILGREYLGMSQKLVPGISGEFDRQINDTVLGLIGERRKVIFENKRNNGSVPAGEAWFELMTKYLEALFDIQQTAEGSLTEQLKDRKTNIEANLAKRLAFLIFSLLLIPLLIVSVSRMTGSIQDYVFKLAQSTLELKEEKRRADTLLYQMFPHSVAELLKKKQQIPAEFYSSVTIFFSDIVDFTKMCSVLTPLQVTAMLDTVYGMFDDRINHYDAYKVETIGDAYMVVSGLPQKNGIMHADQIARMALDFIEVVEGLRVPQFPNGRVKIRIGIHTGPCVSGVVGNKMPRFCLFGDTVNTASRMQTSGEPQQIHISAYTKEVLDEMGGYLTEFRGSLEVKGKGNMCTYWLQGIVDPAVYGSQRDVSLIH